MRSISRRAWIPLGALFCVSAITSSARAGGEAWVTRNGAPWIRIGGTYAGPKMSDVDARARAVISAVDQQASPSLSTSRVERFRDGQTIVRYAQTHRGLPVIGRGASVRLSSGGAPIATAIDLAEGLPANTTASVTPAEAAKVASGRSSVGATDRDAHLVVWPTLDRGARLAYAVLPQVPAGIPTRPRVIIDAETGDVLEARDMVSFAKAQMYASNPLKSPTLEQFEIALSPEAEALSNPFLEAKNCVDKKTVKAVNMFGFNLNVHVCDLEHVAKPDQDGNYIYEPADEPDSVASKEDAFSEVSIFFHAAKAYAFFRELQGDSEAQVIVDKPLRVIANLQMPPGLATGDTSKASNPDVPLEPFQNAFFAPSEGGLGEVFQQLYGFDSGALWFGQGPKRDFAYDGDVVYHEFGHAVVEATLKLGAWNVDARGAIDAPGAMNEGLADYFSSAITGDPDVGEYAASDFGASGESAIRSLANDHGCDRLVGEVHEDSTPFSGALWSARTTLPEADRAKFDAAIYKAMLTNPGRGDLGFDEVGKLFLATLKTDFPDGAAAFEAAMTARGLFPACERIFDYTGTPRKAHEARLGFVAPGRQMVSVKGVAPGIFQLRAKLPEDAGSVTVSFTVRAAAGGAGGLFGGSAKPFTPVVLGKLDAPITWDSKSKTGHDADVSKEAEGESGNTEVTLKLPEGAAGKVLYLQIANKGDSDGSYDNVALSFAPADGDEPEDEVPAPASAPPASIDAGCSTSGGKTPSLLPPCLVAAAALVSAARRRRSSGR